MATGNYSTMSSSFSTPPYYHHASPSMAPQHVPMPMPMIPMPPGPHAPPPPPAATSSPAMHHANATASPAASQPNGSPASPAMHATFQDVTYQSYCNYLYHVGFLQGFFSDVTVSIPSIDKEFALHSLVISRSPTFYRLIHHQQQQQQQQSKQDDDEATSVLTLPLENVSVEAVQMVLQHLYRPLAPADVLFLVSEHAALVLEVLMVADYLELPLKDMLLHTLLSNGFKEASAVEWARLLAPHVSSGGAMAPFMRTIDDQLVHYLTRGLVSNKMDSTLKMSGGMAIGKHQASGYMASKTPPMRGMAEIAQIYASLPWIYMSRCIEHVDLPVQDDLQRFWFAGNVLERRQSLQLLPENNKKSRDPPIIRALRFGYPAPTLANSKRNDDGATMTLALLCASKQRKRGRWDPSLYYTHDDDDDEQSD
ncbi:hypothetical protein BC940DRAFT_175452 [Gongronella butleri]|nr:hypothetical protein BC940DRAFT_175452 [Gongronella butleri]